MLDTEFDLRRWAPCCKTDLERMCLHQVHQDLMLELTSSRRCFEGTRSNCNSSIREVEAIGGQRAVL
jgi:hypothetical protein